MDNTTKPQHIDMQTPDGRQLAMDALAKVIPSCFTETKGDDGELHKVVDFTKLRQLLGDAAVDEAPEVYDFTWVGKRAAMREAAAPISKTLRPCPEESVDWDTTQNLYIEGDNLEVLKLLKNSYMGKVKMIYIDPPYNTGNDFVYHDNFVQSADEYDEVNRDEEGNRFRKNTDSNGRFHSDWCSMIYARLMVARSMLTDDGVIFISIDDNEVENLKKICDEVYGEVNNVGTFFWQSKKGGGSDNNTIVKDIEYVVCYAKNKNNECFLNKLIVEAEALDLEDEKGKYRKGRELNKWGANSRREDRPTMFFPIKGPNNEDVYPIRNDGSEGCWRWGKQNMNDAVNNNDVLFEPRGDGTYIVYEKIRTTDSRTKPYRSYLGEVGATADGSKQIKSIFNDTKVFDFPKPIALVYKLMEMGTSEENLVLDFFSGSATTAHAVMQLNAKDGGRRRFIMVQWPEEPPADSEAAKAGYRNICEIGKERIRRAGKKIKEENPEAKDLDIGFRVFKCDETNYKEVMFTPKDYSQESLDLFVDNIKGDRSDLDLLFDCMLRWGVELSMPLATTKVDGCTIHNVDEGNLVACFDGTVTEKVIDAIAAMSPVRVVFRDRSFTEASTKMNLYELFKQKCGWTDKEAEKNIRVI